MRISLHTQLSNHFITTDYRQALDHATRAVRMAEASGRSEWMARAYNAAGAVCMYMGLNDLAVDYYTRLYAQAEKRGDKAELGAARFNLASVELALNNFARAERFLLESDTLLREGYRVKNQSLPVLITFMYQMNLANVYMNLGAYRKSDSLIALCMPLAVDVPGMEGRLGSLYHLQAMLYLKLKEADRALEAMFKSREIALRLNDEAGYAASFQSTGQAYEMKGDDAAAIREYSAGVRRAGAISQLAVQAILSESLYKLYKKKGMGDSSMRYFEMYTRLSDSSNSEKAREELMRQDLMRTYRKMESEWSAREAQQRRRSLYLFAGLTVMVLIAAGGFFVYRRRYRLLRLKEVQRDLESRRLELEAKRLQAELGHKEDELTKVTEELNRQALMEALSGLNPPSDGGIEPDASTLKRPAGPFNAQSRAWEEFEYRFQQMHSGFYHRLTERYPDLTMNERRLCAFLKLDMTTKEISAITGQSVRAVEIARTRLRRKLNLDQSDMSLFVFLSAL